MTTNERIRAMSSVVVETDLPRHMTIEDYRRERRRKASGSRGILNRRTSVLRRARRVLFSD